MVSLNINGSFDIHSFWGLIGACRFDKLWSPTMPLSDTAIRNAKPLDKPYKLTDAQGL